MLISIMSMTFLFCSYSTRLFATCCYSRSDHPGEDMCFAQGLRIHLLLPAKGIYLFEMRICKRLSHILYVIPYKHIIYHFDFFRVTTHLTWAYIDVVEKQTHRSTLG